MSEYNNQRKNHRDHKNKNRYFNSYDFEEESRRRKDFKKRKRDIKEQDYDDEEEQEYSSYKY